MKIQNFITKKQVSKILGVSCSTVYRWAKNGHLILPFELGPNRTVWDEEELYKWIEKRKKQKGFLAKKPREK